MNEQDVTEAIAKLPLSSAPGLFGYLHGYNVIVTPPEPPKLQLRKEIQVSADFRRKYDAWLLDRFGRVDPMIKGLDVIVSDLYNTMIMRPETAALFSGCSV